MSETHSALPRFDADLISLRALVAIADSGSFSSAARQIGRTQSAVSLQIAKLEGRLGVRLLERTSRSVRTTSAGETLIAYARRVISLADEAMSAVSAQTNHATLRLGIDDCHDRDSILHGLQQFSRNEPLTSLQLHFDHIDALQSAMQADELDLVIGHTLIGQPGFENDCAFDRTVLLCEPLVWAACSGESSAQRPVPLVIPQARSAIRQATLDTLSATGIPWRITTECNSVQALQSAVRAGLGIAALPLSALGEGVVEAHNGLPDLPASALFVDVPAGGRHPGANMIVEQLVTRCNAPLSGASKTLRTERASAQGHDAVEIDLVTDSV